MDTEKFVNELRERSHTALWVLFVADLVISFTFNQPENLLWARATSAIIETAMATLFVSRKNWGRAILFGILAVLSFRFLIS